MTCRNVIASEEMMGMIVIASKEKQSRLWTDET